MTERTPDPAEPGEPDQPRATGPHTSFFPWARATERERASRVALSRDQIVDAAIRILDAEGLDALSMRRLGKELGAGATSLYWHVRNKDELLDLVVDHIIGETIADAQPGLGWREISVFGARAARRVLVKHRGIAPVMGERPTLGPNALEALELLLTPFLDDGFEPMEAFLAATTITNWAFAFAVFECRDPMGPGATTADRDAFWSQFNDYVASLPPDRFPTMLRLLPLAPELTADVQFEYGLQRLLDGIDANRGRVR